MGWVSAAVSIVGGIQQIRAGKEAAKDAKAAAAEQERIARENAAADEAETMEEKRRAQIEFDEESALRRARASGSGIDTDTESSMDIFMGAQEDKYNKEIDWMLQASKSRQRKILSEARYAAGVTRAQGKQAKYSGYSSGLTGIIGGIGAGSNWWGSYQQGSVDWLGRKVTAPNPRSVAPSIK